MATWRPSGVAAAPVIHSSGLLVAPMFEVDEFGEPLRDPVTGLKLPPLFSADPLGLAAVEDVNGDGVIARDGSGDEDGDGLTDADEVFNVGTDPCLADTDGGGEDDGSEIANGRDPFDPTDDV